MTKDIGDIIVTEMRKCAPILETYLHEMAEVEFTVENGKFWIEQVREGRMRDRLGSMRKGPCMPLANLKIAIGMFSEEIISADEVIERLPHEDIEFVLTQGTLINVDELTLIAHGKPESIGYATATVAFSREEAVEFIKQQKPFILCKEDVCRDDTEREDFRVINTAYCLGIIANRGAFSHARGAFSKKGRNCSCLFG